MLRVIIAGGRSFNDYNLLCETCDLAFSKQPKIQVVSGNAKGADSLGEKYANEKNHSLKLFPADWVKHGKSAGMIRNAEMAKYADAVIVFWDGKSPGTKHMIDLAKNLKMRLKIIIYK